MTNGCHWSMSMILQYVPSPPLWTVHMSLQLETDGPIQSMYACGDTTTLRRARELAAHHASFEEISARRVQRRETMMTVMTHVTRDRLELGSIRASTVDTSSPSDDASLVARSFSLRPLSVV